MGEVLESKNEQRNYRVKVMESKMIKEVTIK